MYCVNKINIFVMAINRIRSIKAREPVASEDGLDSMELRQRNFRNPLLLLAVCPQVTKTHIQYVLCRQMLITTLLLSRSCIPEWKYANGVVYSGMHT
jgi:hypothetical protein